MQRWRGGGTLELARALAIGRSANHSFGNNRLHTLHTKDTREPAKNCLEWGCSLRSPTTFIHLRYRGRGDIGPRCGESRRRTSPFFSPPCNCARTSRADYCNCKLAIGHGVSFAQFIPHCSDFLQIYMTDTRHIYYYSRYR